MRTPIRIELTKVSTLAEDMDRSHACDLSWQITPRMLTDAMAVGGDEASVPSKR